MKSLIVYFIICVAVSVSSSLFFSFIDADIHLIGGTILGAILLCSIIILYAIEQKSEVKNG